MVSLSNHPSHNSCPSTSSGRTEFFLSEQYWNLTEDWELVKRLLPEQWEQKARELGAFRRGRGVTDPSTLLRVMLIHLAQGCGLRETALPR